jgi:hypothetical protein
MGKELKKANREKDLPAVRWWDNENEASGV